MIIIDTNGTKTQIDFDNPEVVTAEEVNAKLAAAGIPAERVRALSPEEHAQATRRREELEQAAAASAAEVRRADERLVAAFERAADAPGNLPVAVLVTPAQAARIAMALRPDWSDE